MNRKIGLLCLSIMVTALAVGYSANNNESIKTNATINESLAEIRSTNRTKGKDEDESSSSDFLSIAESATISKNIVDTNNKITQEKVTITLDKVVRGDDAKKEVDDYNSSNRTSKIPQLVDDSLEYIIIEYTTTLPNDIKSTNNGQSSPVGIKVCNSDGNCLQTNENNYSLRAVTFEKSQGLHSADSGITKAVLTIPKNITEFVVKLGDNSSDMCSYLIK